ncbi:lipase maturation factor family protein [Bdellovibrio bacteriovorus]|uniref:lipase maturation factor family protein n=1 Tax=Bdellovibrio bacteriovorus TaxID=959 RepID=UPI0035A702C0
MDYNISSWIISKTLSISYFIAFLSLLPQVLGLYGQQGILSIDHLLNLLDKELKGERFYHVPSFFWFSSTDFTLKATCFIGMMASSLAFLGFSQSIMFAVCFLCYLSFVSCGQIFLSYQWDSLLLELGFLGLFFAPWKWEWLPLGTHLLHPMVYGLVLLLLFKLMFLSGVVKLTHKDTCWRDFTALTYHYWTQPLPTPLAYFMNKMPLTVKKLSTLFMFFVELVTPFFIFIPGPAQTAAVVFLVLLQVLIFLTGNYCFFNIITLGLSLAVLPDSTWGFKINWVENTTIPFWLAMVPVVLLVPASLFLDFQNLVGEKQVSGFSFTVHALLVSVSYLKSLWSFRRHDPHASGTGA